MTVHLKFISLFILLSTAISAHSQDGLEISINPDKSSKKDKENKVDKKADNIIDYSDLLNVKIFSSVKSNIVGHYDSYTDKTYEYKPNETTNLGFGINYKWFGLDVGFNIQPWNDDEDTFGKTSRLDLQSNIYMHKLVLDINFQHYKGYFIPNNSDDQNFTPTNPEYIIRPDIQTDNIGLSGLYIFNHDHFSYRSAFTFNEKQLKSAGSFLAGTYLSIYKMQADSSLIPAYDQDIVDPEADFRDVGYVTFWLTGGYAHNFIIFKDFFISLTLVVGFGVESGQRKETETLPEYDSGQLGSFGIIRTSLGYNGEKWFAGFSTVNTVSKNANEDVSHLARSVSQIKLFLGRRLNPPKFLTKSKK